ncbi:MAG: ribosome maturation factor RimP [Rhodospirillales bacterium]|nr:ribosome maturation factor RimP [Rhodospirillales bacterium]
MQTENRIEALITPVLDAMGYNLVRLQLSDAPDAVLQIMAERNDNAGMGVDDCTKISREVSAILDVEDPVDGAFTLEVSSPGIDRPLVKLEDFEKFAGFDARVDLNKNISGQRKFRGKLLGVSGDAVEIVVGGEPKQFLFSQIRRAKLLLTDELLATAATEE